ncbi:hypothetical protein Y5A_019130 [Burkholderia glumae AU6208]|nr:hypothetical protein Y5A_019130 [Burkholderia glumae AU6208]
MPAAAQSAGCAGGFTAGGMANASDERARGGVTDSGRRGDGDDIGRSWLGFMPGDGYEKPASGAGFVSASCAR